MAASPGWLSVWECGAAREGVLPPTCAVSCTKAQVSVSVEKSDRCQHSHHTQDEESAGLLLV